MKFFMSALSSTVFFFGRGVNLRPLLTKIDCAILLKGFVERLITFGNVFWGMVLVIILRGFLFSLFFVCSLLLFLVAFLKFFMSDFVGLVREKTGFGLSFVLLVLPLDSRESHLHCSYGVHLEICVIEMTVGLAMMMGSIVVFGQSKNSLLLVVGNRHVDIVSLVLECCCSFVMNFSSLDCCCGLGNCDCFGSLAGSGYFRFPFHLFLPFLLW